ncbi:MAG TPA: hypothetical protein VFV08_06480 [Puia sp.]|nr:hypothetical protein [Puia sp.]
MNWIDLIGWLGSAMVIAAYGLNMYGKISADTILYYMLNILGSACLIVNTFYHNAIPSAVVNIIWILIAILALGKKYFRANNPKKSRESSLE